jgi:hypothetical protein
LTNHSPPPNAIYWDYIESYINIIGKKCILFIIVITIRWKMLRHIFHLMGRTKPVLLRICFHLIRWNLCRNFFHRIGHTVKVSVKALVKNSHTDSNCPLTPSAFHLFSPFECTKLIFLLFSVNCIMLLKKATLKLPVFCCSATLMWGQRPNSNCRRRP